VDQGERPSVASAIVKYHCTERMRLVVNDGMDILGGSGICIGPRNLLGRGYQALPIGITVEGANILTRTLITFGQGVIRCHPFVLDEMRAMADPDRARGLAAFDRHLRGHLAHGLSTAARSLFHGLARGRLAPAPGGPGRRYYQAVTRYSAAFALTADLALLTLGGALKRKEMLSARFSDILSELYLSSAALKRWNDEGRQNDDFPLLEWCMEASFATIATRFDEIIANFPSRPVAWLLRLLIQPLGPRRRGPSDHVTERCAEIITNPCPARDRLTVDLYHPSETENENGLALLERAFAMTVAVQPIRDRMRTARVRDIDQALKQRTITADEAAQLNATASAVAAAIAVDDFAPEELTSRGASNKGDVSSQATSQRPPEAAPQPQPAAAE